MWIFTFGGVKTGTLVADARMECGFKKWYSLYHLNSEMHFMLTSICFNVKEHGDIGTEVSKIRIDNSTYTH